MTANDRIIVNGEVNLILNEGFTLTANKGIQVFKGNTLSIYAQMNGTGKILAVVTDTTVYGAGIGGGYINGKSGTFNDLSCGTINIYGGTIEAKGGESCAGIGSGSIKQDTTDGGTINIYGGTVKATGGNSGAGIGGGSLSSNNNSTNFTNPPTVNIYGGVVTAIGGDTGAGIGGGYNCPGGEITITGGNITATSTRGCGIGYGRDASEKGATINLGWTNYTDSIKATGSSVKDCYAFGKNSTINLTKEFMYGNSPAQAHSTGNVRVNEDVTIVPAVKITFASNGGSGEMGEVKTAYGNSYTLPECSFSAPNDMAFDKWLAGDVEIDVGGSFDVTADTVVKALWKDNSRTVTFDANGHGTAPDAQTVNINEKATKPDDPTADGYTFGGWYKEAACENTWNFDSDTVTEDLTLYAKWTADIYTIGYDLAGGALPEGVSNPTEYTVESEAITLNNPTRTGYDFAGWTGSADVTSSRDVTITKGSTGNRSYTATWTAHSYSITYDLAGGNVSAANPKTYTIESTDFTLNNPTMNAYTFTGWTGTDLTQATQTVTITHGSTGDRSYTAHWRAIAYTISYDLDGGTLPDGHRVSYDIESGTFTLPKPSRDGYEFGGWTLSGDNAPASTDLKVPAGATGDREYIAHWEAIRYTLSYDLAGGSGDNPKSYTIESEDFILNRPTMAGQRFAGWTGSADVTSSRDVTITKGSTGNRTYTATWGEYPNTYYVRTPDDLNITTMGWNFPAGVITASADKDDFDPNKKIVVTATSPNGWALKDTVFWHFNSDTVPYTLKNAITDTEPTTSWTFTYSDLTQAGGTTITFGAMVEDFSTKRPGSYEDPVTFTVEVSE